MTWEPSGTQVWFILGFLWLGIVVLMAHVALSEDGK